MNSIRPEVTGRRSGVAEALNPGPGNRGPPFDPLDNVISIQEAARIAGVSVDYLRKHHRDKFVKRTPNRDGMTLRDALGLREGK